MGAGTDATRVASYNPWICIAWLITARRWAALAITPVANRLDRETALRLYTEGSAWFSGEPGRKGQIKAGQFADLTLLSADLMGIPEDEISRINLASHHRGAGASCMATASFSSLAPPMPRASPDWSPVNTYGGYHRYQPVARDAAVLRGALHRACASPLALAHR